MNCISNQFFRFLHILQMTRASFQNWMIQGYIWGRLPKLKSFHWKPINKNSSKIRHLLKNFIQFSHWTKIILKENLSSTILMATSNNLKKQHYEWQKEIQIIFQTFQKIGPDFQCTIIRLEMERLPLSLFRNSFSQMFFL